MQLYFTKGLTCVMYDMSNSAKDSFIRIWNISFYRQIKWYNDEFSDFW